MDVMKQAKVDTLTRMLTEKGYTHLKVKARGQHFTIYSEEDGTTVPRLRLTAIPADQYALSFPTRSGKWERTPFVGTRQDLLEIVETMFGWHLESW